ncbi:MAG: polyprenyl synthetase family protein [Clostridia bacterium]|nr:polyprenyl synthetase family protein [Clostridia bacterium]
MMEEYRKRVETALASYADSASAAPILKESMRYGLLNGGKRIRPCLLLCCAQMLGGTVNEALPFACALEMIHSYSLIHDDLPAMDNDDMRRGQPSTHKAFGEANGILAGDGLLTYAALLLALQPRYDAAKQMILSCALDMVSGQSYDLNDSERSESMLNLLHRKKTGALFCAALSAGAVIAGREDLVESFSDLGYTIGLLFQITDDLLDSEKDLAEQKLTYVTYYGRERSLAFAKEAEAKALSILAPYQNEAADTLRAVIAALTNRTE